MIIGIDASRANILQRTGTEWYAFHIIQELKTIIPSEHTVRLYVKEPLLDDLYPIPENWFVVVLDWPPKLLWTQIRLSFEMYRRKIDVLYVPAHTIPITHPKKTVTVIHDVGFFENESLYAPSAVSKKRGFKKAVLSALVRILTAGQYGASEKDYHRFSFWLAAREASSIITISNFSKNAIIKIAPHTAKKISLIYNGLHTHESSLNTVDSHAILDSYAIAHQQYIMTLGRVEEKKNSVFLVKVFAAMVHAGYAGKLVFVGKEGFGFDRVAAEVRKHSLMDKVVFTGYVNDETTSSLLSHADVFVLPTLYEGFGMPILEAMAAQVPVACSDIPVLREVGGEAAVFANPYSVDSWLKAFAEISSNRNTYVRAGVAQARKYSWKKAAQQTWEILSK